MSTWKQKKYTIDVEIQKALGVLDMWEIRIYILLSTWGDPPEIQQLFEQHIPFFEPWSDNTYHCYATASQIDEFKQAIVTIKNPKYQEAVDANISRKLRPFKYLPIRITSKKMER